MTEILLLGAFHFLQSKIDVLNEDNQRQIRALADNLIRFNPDAICVEAGIQVQSYIDKLYQNLKLSDFDDYEKMKTSVLGEILLYDNIYPVKYNNESIQIAFRLGKLSSLNKIYAIDDETPLNDNLNTLISDEKKIWQENINCFIEETNEIENNVSLIEYLKILNVNDWSNRNHDIVYLKANSIGGYPSYVGAKMVSSWYERNLKIFSNIQRLAKSYKRIFIVYGAGHLKLLKDFINESDDLCLVDINNYLNN